MKLYAYEDGGKFLFYPRKDRALSMARSLSSQTTAIVEVFEVEVLPGTQREMLASAASHSFASKKTIAAFRKNRSLKGWVE